MKYVIFEYFWSFMWSLAIGLHDSWWYWAFETLKYSLGGSKYGPFLLFFKILEFLFRNRLVVSNLDTIVVIRGDYHFFPGCPTSCLTWIWYLWLGEAWGTFCLSSDVKYFFYICISKTRYLSTDFDEINRVGSFWAKTWKKRNKNPKNCKQIILLSFLFVYIGLH